MEALFRSLDSQAQHKASSDTVGENSKGRGLTLVWPVTSALGLPAAGASKSHLY